jgi:hypothetical protein
MFTNLGFHVQTQLLDFEASRMLIGPFICETWPSLELQEKS